MRAAANVLLIEDEAVDAALARRCLTEPMEPRLRLEHVGTLAAGIDRVSRGDLDAILLDLRLPDSEGADTVVRLRARDPAIPILVLTGAGDEETAFAALAAGAEGYLVKDEITGPLLRRSVRHAIERRRSAGRSERLAQRARRLERREQLRSFSAGIGFGFNTLIGTIVDRCDHALALLDDPDHKAPVHKDLLEIHRAAFRAAEMVQRLRDYAALERADTAVVDLARFVLEAEDFLSLMVSPEIDLCCEGSGEALYVEVPRPELHRLLVSLVVNAAEAIGDRSGSISIELGRLDADEDLLAETEGWPAPRPGPYVFLRVADGGCGLGASRRERLFDPFYTTKFAGRGLGLAGVLGILHRRRSVIQIADNHPVGTVFTVLFPQAARPVVLAS